MFRKMSLLLCLLVLCSGVAFVQAHEGHVCELSYLFNAWARPTTNDSPVSAVYGHLVRLGEADDTLISASTPAAEMVQLHEMVVGDDQVMRMNEKEGGFAVPANHFIALEPGGLHIMLMGLTQELVAGEQLALTLTFEKAGEVQLSVPIQDPDAMMMDREADDMAMSEEPARNWGEGCDKLFVVDPWVRPAIGGAPNSAAYGLLVNLTAEEETLLSVAATVSEVVELHEMVMGANDVMQMRPIDGGVVIPAGSATLLKPGGLHIMLIGLTGELAVADSVEFVLTFANSAPITLTAPVREPDAQGGMNMGGHQHGG